MSGRGGEVLAHERTYEQADERAYEQAQVQEYEQAVEQVALWHSLQVR